MRVWKDGCLWCDLEDGGNKCRFYKDNDGYAVLNEIRDEIGRMIHPDNASSEAFRRAAKAMGAKVAA